MKSCTNQELELHSTSLQKNRIDCNPTGCLLHPFPTKATRSRTHRSERIRSPPGLELANPTRNLTSKHATCQWNRQVATMTSCMTSKYRSHNPPLYYPASSTSFSPSNLISPLKNLSTMSNVYFDIDYTPRSGQSMSITAIPSWHKLLIVLR